MVSSAAHLHIDKGNVQNSHRFIVGSIGCIVGSIVGSSVGSGSSVVDSSGVPSVIGSSSVGSSLVSYDNGVFFLF